MQPDYFCDVPKKKSWRHSRILSKADPLTDEISNMLKREMNYKLSSSDKDALRDVLETNEFRMLIGDTYTSVLDVIPYVAFDSAKMIIDLIGPIAATCFHLKKNRYHMIHSHSEEIKPHLQTLPIIDFD